MAHSVSEQAARAVKNSERKQTETRTPEQILKGIRNSLVSHTWITPSDVQFLLGQYDAVTAQYQAAVAIITDRNHEVEKLQHIIEDRATDVRDLQVKLDEFRAVYEQENRSTTLK